ncbi:MAG TPA: histidine kinase [Flavitalea sp.]|nr:histidine kinase [Flavitalea sp.]
MKWWTTLSKYKLHHLLFWSLFFAGWHFFRSTDYAGASSPWVITAVKVAVLMVLTYITNYFLIPKLLYTKKYLLFFSTYLVLIFGLGLLKLHIVVQLIYPGINSFDNFKTRVYDNIIPLFLLVSTGAAWRLINDYLRSQRRLTEIAIEKSETELKFLKSQINPHFLFNSLNSIYFLIDKQNTEARNTLLQFSDLLRYQLYECNADKIEIEKEVSYLKDYIKLQQLRKDNNYHVNVAIENDVRGFSIVPLLLIPFVENAFKHISHHSNGKNFVDVQLQRNNGTFTFVVENSKENHQHSIEPPGGIGLKNVKRRLELLYADKHTLDIINNDSTFKVALHLSVN